MFTLVLFEKNSKQDSMNRHYVIKKHNVKREWNVPFVPCEKKSIY